MNEDLKLIKSDYASKRVDDFRLDTKYNKLIFEYITKTCHRIRNIDLYHQLEYINALPNVSKHSPITMTDLVKLYHYLSDEVIYMA